MNVIISGGHGMRVPTALFLPALATKGTAVHCCSVGPRATVFPESRLCGCVAFVPAIGGVVLVILNKRVVSTPQVRLNACSLSQLERFGERFPGGRVGIRFNPGVVSLVPPPASSRPPACCAVVSLIPSHPIPSHPIPSHPIFSCRLSLQPVCKLCQHLRCSVGRGHGRSTRGTDATGGAECPAV